MRHHRLASLVSAFRATLRREGALLAGAVALLVAGCGGGGSSGSIVGLSIADQMSVVTAGGGSGSPVVTPAAGPGGGPSFPADADYETDEQHAWVYDPSMEPLQTVNMILCLLKQTGYAALVNEGTYLAQIDENACEQGSDQGSSGTGESSGSNAGQPAIWTVQSERSSNGSSQIVEFWIPNENDGDSGPMTIWARLEINEKASDLNPFGAFVMNFAGVPDGGAIDDAVFQGTLRTLDVADGFLGFSFFMAKGDVTQVPPPDGHAEVVQANVNMFLDQTEGVARIRRQHRENFPPAGDTGLLTEEYLIAFDPSHLLRSKDGDPGTCLSRSDFESRVWRYNLYDSTTGERVDLESGFGFRTPGGDYGWIGYWGLWAPPEADLENGDTITQDQWGVANPPTYTLVLAPGKLIQNTKNTLDVTELAGESFQWWDFQPGNPPAQYEVVYDLGTWFKVAVWNDATHEFEDLPSPDPIVLAPGQFLGMWSQSLGGQVSYVAGDAFITYWARKFVNGANPVFDSAATVDLYGYFNCLSAGVTAGDAEMGDVYEIPSNDVAQPYHYVFQQSDLTLYFDVDGDGSNLVPAGLAPGEVPLSGPFTWGMQSGPMIVDTGNLADTNQIWTQNVFYTYETGANPWNQYASVIDSNDEFVTFDAPIQFTYTHATANDRNDDATYDGHNYFLGYNGAGNLFGIPQDGVDLDGDGNPDRWYPLFSLADGVAMGRNGIEFVVKAIEMEQTLAEDPGNCTGLDISNVGNLTLPDASGYTPPDIGPPPVVDDAPRVIEGVVQGP